MSYRSGSKYKYALDQYGKTYDNKAYAANQNPVYQDDHVYHEPQDFSRKKSGRGKILIIGLVCFILLAAAIAIGVYFGVRSKSDDDEPDVAATIQMTVSLDETWNDELYDPTSQAYMDKKKEVEEGIDKVMLDVEGYKGSTVTGFNSGSINADANLAFKNNVIMDGNQRKALTADVAKDIFKKKVAAQKALNNAFAAKIVAEVITAELKTGAIGNVDLGNRCSMDKDCQDRNTECSNSPKICKCKTNFYNANTKDNGGSCRPTKAYGSQCTIDRQCAFGGGQCKDSKCGCSGDMFRKNNQCNDKIDIDRSGCDVDGECKYTGAKCSLRACRCPTDTFKGNLKCLAKIGIDKEGCSQDGDCKYGKCISRFCRCPDNKVFDMDGCKDPADVMSFCHEKNFNTSVKEICGDSWKEYQLHGENRQLELFLGCMWTNAYTKGQNCDLQKLLSDLHYSELNEARRPLHISACSVSWTPYDDSEIELVLSTSKDSDTVSVQLIIPNEMVEENTYVVAGISSSPGEAANKMALLVEYVDPKQHRFRGSIQYATSESMTYQYSILDEHLSILQGRQYTSVIVQVTKSFTVQGLSMVGEKYLQFGMGPMDVTLDKTLDYTMKKASPNKFQLTCDTLTSDRLGQLIPGVTKKEDLCTLKQMARYLLEHKCFIGLASNNFDEKCVTRIIAKDCIFDHFSSEEKITCTIEQIETTLNDPYVKWKLMENYPPTSCESKYTSCERKFLQGIFKMDCMDSLMMASLLTRFHPNLHAITSADGSTPLPCSLWKGTYQCMNKFFIQNPTCTHSSVNGVMKTVASVAQKNTQYTQVRDSTYSQPGSLTKTDFSLNCDVSDISPPTDSCPSLTLTGDTTFVACLENVLYNKDACVRTLQWCVHDHMKKLYENFGCEKDIKETLPSVMERNAAWFNLVFKFNFRECIDILECVADMMQPGHEACTEGMELINIVNKMENQNEVCVSRNVVIEHLFPACIKMYNLKDKCIPLGEKIWNFIYNRELNFGLQETRLDNCNGYTANTCAALTIRTVLKCFWLHHREGDCRVAQCINSETAPDSCPAGTSVNAIEVLERAKAMYGRIFLCELQDCGVGIFTTSVTTMCGLAWKYYTESTKPEEKCKAYEATLGCTAFMLRIQGKRICGFETLHTNFAAGASKLGVSPSVCSNAASKYTDLDKLFSENDDICTNIMVFHSIMAFFCPLPPQLFSGDTDKDKCMREVWKKTCVLTIFEASNLTECTLQRVWDAAKTPAIREGMFELDSGCEANYPCVTQALQSRLNLTNCLTPINNYLAMSSLGVYVNGQTDMENKGLLKCKVWEMATGCGLTILPNCVASVSDVQAGLSILSNAVTARSEYAPTKVDIFQSCPAFDTQGQASVCPRDGYMPYVAAGYCVYQPAKAHREGLPMKDSCGDAFLCFASTVNALKPFCPAVEAQSAVLYSTEHLAYLQSYSGLACTPPALVTCMEAMPDDCNFASTLLVEHKLKKDKKCAAAHLITRELMPSCFKLHNLPDECSDNIPEIWEELLKRGKMEYKIKETELDDCDKYVVDKCADQDLNAVMRCYEKFKQHFGNSDCRLVNCIEMATNTDCPSKKLNKVKMYMLVKEIYGEIPECYFQACGVKAFARMVAYDCAGAWNVWAKTENVVEKCNAFQAFLGCVAFEYLSNDIDRCGFEVLSNNMDSQAQENGYEKPSICAGNTYALMDRQFPNTTAGVCDNTFVFRSIIIYFCPASEVIFNTEEDHDLCMTEIGRKACLYQNVSEFDCTVEVVNAKLATPEVRTGIFPLEVNCESTYPCVTQTVGAGLIDVCVKPVTQYVTLSQYGVDVDGAMAINSQDKLKCIIWDLATICARMVTTCTDSDQIRDGIRIRMHMSLAPYPDLSSKLNIFDGCPAFPSTFDPCPNDEEFLYNIIPQCVLEALRLKEVGYDEHDIACNHVLKCAHEIANGYYLQYVLQCPGAVESFRKMTSDENRAFLKRVTQLDCPRAGSCPSVGEGQEGSCVHECNDDTECPGGINKCCFNGCSHTCQAPNLD